MQLLIRGLYYDTISQSLPKNQNTNVDLIKSP